MTVGRLTLRIELHESGRNCNRIRYGPEEPISGDVVLKYTRDPTLQNSNQLFGPLHIDLTLKGFLRVSDGRGLSETLAQHRLLVNKVNTVYDGTYRAEQGDEQRFPFSVFFPEFAQPRVSSSISAAQNDNGQWQFHSQYSPDAAEPLPPTLLVEDVMSSDIRVEYKISAGAQLPGIDVSILDSWAETPILYDRPRVPRDAAITLTDAKKSFDQVLVVHSKELVPNALRPHGFAEKTKALMKSVEAPAYAFMVTCWGISTHLFVGQSIGFSVSIACHLRKTTSTVVPEVFLSKCTVTLIASTTSQALPGTTGKGAVSVQPIRAKDADIMPSGPFHKGHEYTKNVDLGVLSHVPSTFSFSELSRSYKLRIHMEFTAASEVLHTSRQFDVVVYPALDEPIGSGAIAYDAPPPLEEDEVLPSYGEVVAAGPSNVRVTE